MITEKKTPGKHQILRETAGELFLESVRKNGFVHLAFAFAPNR
jgi:hypothetical protein